MQKEKSLTQDDIDLLFSEKWLTNKQQSEFDIYEGVVKTYEEIEKLCPDQAVLNFIFYDAKVEPINIRYNLVTYHRGEETNSETFDSIKDAITQREKLIKSGNILDFKIEVSYDLKDSN